MSSFRVRIGMGVTTMKGTPHLQDTQNWSHVMRCSLVSYLGLFWSEGLILLQGIQSMFFKSCRYDYFFLNVDLLPYQFLTLQFSLLTKLLIVLLSQPNGYVIYLVFGDLFFISFSPIFLITAVIDISSLKCLPNDDNPTP